jgi:hypothetical protein
VRVARVARLAGAIVVESGADFYLVGNTKRPCAWNAVGFEAPDNVDALRSATLRLVRRGTPALTGPWLAIPTEDGAPPEALPRVLATRFLIERNGSVSDRLWRLVLGADPEGDDPPPDTVIDARWLIELPSPIWEIVRERVLRCL